MEAGTYVDPAIHYEEAAEFCAKWGVTNPMLAIALYRMHPSTVESIECDPHAFERRVHDYLYAAAMSRI